MSSAVLTGSCGGWALWWLGDWWLLATLLPCLSSQLACCYCRWLLRGGGAPSRRMCQRTQGGRAPARLNKAVRRLGSSARGKYDADNSEMLIKFMATEGLLNRYSPGLSTPFLALFPTPFNGLLKSYFLHFFECVKNDRFQGATIECYSKAFWILQFTHIINAYY